MGKRNLIILSCLCVFMFSACGNLKKEEVEPVKASAPAASQNQENNEAAVSSQKTVSKTPEIPKTEIKKIRVSDLYSENNELPLSAIASIAGVKAEARSVIDNYLDNTTIYFLKPSSDATFIVASSSDSEKFQRHGIELIKVRDDGEKEVIQLAEVSDDNDDNDAWEFDEETKLPVRHVRYDDEGEIEYAEFWHYSPENPVKYELKDGEGKTISIKKEIQDGASNIRVENLVYDENGKTKLNVTTNYEGPQITRFTYYNSDDPQNSVVVTDEYLDGQKVKESIYTSDYKLQNTFEASYENGKRTSIKVIDGNNKEIEEIVSE